jgi:hypothetical protein
MQEVSQYLNYSLLGDDNVVSMTSEKTFNPFYNKSCHWQPGAVAHAWNCSYSCYPSYMVNVNEDQGPGPVLGIKERSY